MSPQQELLTRAAICSMDDTLDDLLSVQPLLLTKEVQQILQPQEQEESFPITK